MSANVFVKHLNCNCAQNSCRRGYYENFMRSSAVFANYHWRAQDRKNRMWMWRCRQGQINMIFRNVIKMCPWCHQSRSSKSLTAILISYFAFDFETLTHANDSVQLLETSKRCHVLESAADTLTRHSVSGVNTDGANEDGTGPSVLGMSQNSSHDTFKWNAVMIPLISISPTGHTFFLANATEDTVNAGRDCIQSKSATKSSCLIYLLYFGARAGKMHEKQPLCFHVL